jgi:hypothetical protein
MLLHVFLLSLKEFGDMEGTSIPLPVYAPKRNHAGVDQCSARGAFHRSGPDLVDAFIDEDQNTLLILNTMAWYIRDVWTHGCLFARNKTDYFPQNIKHPDACVQDAIYNWGIQTSTQFMHCDIMDMYVKGKVAMLNCGKLPEGTKHVLVRGILESGLSPGVVHELVYNVSICPRPLENSKYEVVAAIMVKNHAEDVKRWISYHIAIGVEHILV